MRLLIVAIGDRAPAWARTAFDTFAERMPREARIELKALKAEARNGRSTPALMAAEACRLEGALPKGVHRVALDEHGARCSTAALAERWQAWMRGGRDIAFLIGGPDGLDARLKTSADETLRLSDLTLPHALARVLLAESLYRAWSLSAGHPYHRE